MRLRRRPPSALTLGLFLGPLVACEADPGRTEATGAPVGLGEPTGTLADDFGSIQTVREMPDGRVLVADPLGRALYLVDLDAGTRTVVGSEGEGPGEYLQPDAVWPLPGDSTLLVDLGNGRLVALGPDLSFGPTMPIVMGEPSLGGGLVLATPQGVDRAGRVYAPSRGGGLSAEPPDSGAILRIDRASQRFDTVGAFKLEGQIRTVTSSGRGRGVRVSPIPLSPEDAWGVAPDGAVAVARAGEYRLDWLAPDGTVVQGPVTPHAPLPLGTAEKEEWDAERSREPGLSVSVSISPGGAAETSFTRGGRGRASGGTDLSQFDWPEVLPPIHSGRLPIDPRSRAWVRRHVGAGGPTTYDVFDRDGVRVGTVALDPDRQVIGFGADAVYVVAYDEFDLNYLERYAMPQL